MLRVQAKIINGKTVYRLNVDGHGMGDHRRRVNAIMRADGAEARKAAAEAKRQRKAAKRLTCMPNEGQLTSGEQV